MQTTQGSTLQSLRAVDAFIDANPTALASVANTGARTRLKAMIADLATHTSEQASNGLVAQGATKNQESLRQALLRDHMAPIARIARLDLPLTPQIEPLRMPRGNPNTERLAQAAKGMATAATPYVDIFTGAGLPADFIQQLNAAADALVASFDDGVQSRGKRRGSTDGLKKKLTTGRKIVSILDAMITTALKGNTELLGNWNSVKRVRRIAVRSTSTNTNTSTSTSTSTTASTTTTTSTTPTTGTTSSPSSPTPPAPVAPASASAPAPTPVPATPTAPTAPTSTPTAAAA